MNNNRMTLTSYGPWLLIKCLGSGAFGEVHHWKHNVTGQEIATKRLKPNPKLRPDEISILYKRWSQEYEWMKMLTTECIVGAAHVNDNDFLDYLKRQSHVEHTLPVIVMEYCNGGDLRGQLNKIENFNGLAEYEVRCVLYTLRESIKYLHLNYKIEHRDIKPENIVLHITGNQKLYKLADFGYARKIPDYTVDQSVVGTLNYVAPEIIETGCYTETVDYWSAGHVAYEIICGTLPFIPHHQDIVKRMTAIKNKPSRCIKIVQKIDPGEEEFEYGYELPHCNHCSPLFNDHMKKWLCLSLDKNYKTRGYNDLKELKFYSLLDDILNTKILTVFSLKKMKKFYYDIESFSNMREFAEKLAADNNINIDNLFLTTPPLHPKQQFRHPSDYFVSEWCDTRNSENPPVMLYVNEFLKLQDYNININEFFEQSSIILGLMNINPQDHEVPPWLLKQFEKEVLFILTDKQNLLTSYMMGLQRFVMQIQHVVFLYENTICEVNDRILLLSGNVQLLSTVIDEIKKQQNGHLQEKIETDAIMFYGYIQELQHYKDIIKSTYKSIVQKCKVIAEMDFYKQMIEKDIFLLKEYCSFLAQVNNNDERLHKAQHYFDNCYQKFSAFVDNRQRKEIVDSIDKEIQNFNALVSKVTQIKCDIDYTVKKVEEATRSLLKDYHTNNELSKQMDTLNLDGRSMQDSKNYSFNNPSLALNCDSLTLMNDSLQLMDVITDQCRRMNSLP